MPEITQSEVDEVESSRAEKLLAIGLVAFLLVGGFWVMDRLGSVPRQPDYVTIAASVGLPAVEESYRKVEADFLRAQEGAQQAAAAAEQARSEYEFRREEYRVALERGVSDPELAQAHEAARQAYEQAVARSELAEATRVSFQNRMAGLQAAYQQVQERAGAAVKKAENRYQLLVFALRFGYALPLFGLAVWLWLALRRRPVRYLIVATAFMGFAGIQAIALVGQYSWHLLRDIGPIALSATGSAVCVAGLVAIKRWASNARRLAIGRLRRNQCPFCGFPLAAGAAFCAGCGRRVSEPCPACGAENAPQSPFCRHCGKTLG